MSKTMKEFEEFVFYVDSIDDELLSIPIAEGKWTVKEVITHLTNWDAYSIEKMVPYMKDNAILPEFINHDTHNVVAIELAKSYKDRETLKNDFRETRKRLVSLLNSIGSDITFTIGKGKRKYTVDSYAKIFVHHDKHHQGQIENVRSSYKENQR
ncbi:DinB family protein [Paenibacillus sp. An7]|uniref:DinB family protein n=1 Tax=Paenibacillus sp. An7 TaxID=2689577 RepID=UPI0013570D95|nr:DinB family protein [Paenibacillus sp. An7]